MSSLFEKQAGLVAFLIFRWRTGCDQPEWGPADEWGIMLKDPNPPKTQLWDKTDNVSQCLFITKQADFLHALSKQDEYEKLEVNEK